MTTTNKNLRKDVVSRKMLEKHELFRIVLNKKNEIFVDQTYKADGRGVYIKKDKDSIIQAKSKNLLSKGLKTKVDISIYETLEKILNE